MDDLPPNGKQTPMTARLRFVSALAKNGQARNAHPSNWRCPQTTVFGAAGFVILEHVQSRTYGSCRNRVSGQSLMSARADLTQPLSGCSLVMARVHFRDSD